MIVISPSAVRTVVFVNYSGYTLPKRHLHTDLSKTLGEIPERAYSNGFTLNLENLFSSLIVVLLPESYVLDSKKLVYPYSQNYEIIADYSEFNEDLMLDYTKKYSFDKSTLGESDTFNEKVLVIHKNTLAGAIDNIECPNPKNIKLFLEICTTIRLDDSNANPNFCYSFKNTEEAKPLARLCLEYAAKLLEFNLTFLSDDLLDYFMLNAVNLKSAITFVGMACTLVSSRTKLVTLAKFVKKFSKEKTSKKYASLSVYNSNIGSLLIHSVRSEAFSKLNVGQAYYIGKVGFSESSQSTTLSLLRLLRSRGIEIDRIHTLYSLFVELIVTSNKETHNEVRHFLVTNGLLPKHTKFDYTNLMRLDQNIRYPTVDATLKLIVAVALGADSKTESVAMH